MRLEPTRRDRSAVGLGAAALAVFFLAACSGKAPSGGAPPSSSAPTVVVVSIDTLRADRLGCYGRADAGTPVLDRLAAEGVRFTSAQTTAPLTLPAHTSLLSGRSVPAHGVRNNGTYAVTPAVPLVAESFRSAGYATAAFVSSPVLARRYGLGRGFEIYDDAIARAPRRQGLVVHFEERAGRETSSRAVQWVAALGDRPAFLWVHYWEPHAPYQPPPEFARFADRYQGEVAAVDAAIGTLVDGIRATGRTNLTIAIVSDHGEGLGEHGEPTHGVFLYRATMAIPFLFVGPGLKPGVVDAPVSIADVAPTLLELGGLPPLPGADAASLAAGLTGRGPYPVRAGVFAQSDLPQIEFGWSGLRALVTPDQKLIDAPRPELFARTDLAESSDLAPARASDVARARSALQDLVRRSVAAAPAESAERAPSSEDIASLRSLGYSASGRRTGAATPLVDPKSSDPKDRASFLARFDDASFKLERGEAAAALPILAALEKEDPRNPGLLQRYGEALIVAKDIDGAIAVFRKAVAVDPGFALAWYRLGQLLDAKRDLAGAEAAYEHATRIDPLAVEPRKALAGLLGEARRYAEAVEVLEQVQRLDPHDPAVARDIQRFRAGGR